jgi:16S rRNA A1518/A1519 N6-dimethyltransferase RsmA/KsgA/DIM1 with predicted DNA glycosylase/AP lyase activity
MAIFEDSEGHELAAFASADVVLAGRRVLEIGCGEGRLTRRVLRDAASIIAIDPDAAAIARLAAEWPGIDARAVPVDRLQLAPHTVDAVLFSWSL